MRALLRTLVLAGIACSAGRAAESGGCIWLEAETPESSAFPIKPWPAEPSPVFSGGRWFTYTLDKGQVARGLPKDGLTLRYRFDSPGRGNYEFWARVGYEWARPPMDWRIDSGAWQTAEPDLQTTNLVEVAPWCEVAWLKVGTVELGPGKHTLEIRYLKPGHDGRLLIGLDCFALAPAGQKFVPEGALRPGQEYEQSVDVEARQHVFRFSQPLSGSPERRVELPLDGLWEAARYDDPDMDKGTYEPIVELPDPAVSPQHWLGVSVPGDAARRAELNFAHRLLYRARIDVPAALAGRGFYLHFGGTCWIASVLVNGQYVGAHQSVLVPWDIDISRVVRPGQVNTIIVGVKSPWYAIDAPARNTTLDHLRNVPSSHFKWSRFVDAVYPSTKGEGDGTQTGIVNPVKLVVAGPVYTADVFVRTSVAQGRLDAQFAIRNPTSQPAKLTLTAEAVHEQSGQVETRFEPVEVAMPANCTKLVSLGGAWTNPKLWWPEDHADLYLLRTTLARDGRPIDVHQQLFGFREVRIDGRQVTLNGIPWHFWNWVDVGRAANGQEWLQAYHAQNDRFHRIAADHDRLFGTREQALEFFDRHGVPGRLSTCIDGMFITHEVTNPLVWHNFEDHVQQVVRAYRNHPSIVMWSLENELMFVTCRLAQHARYHEMEQKCARLCAIAKELDPTRSSFPDGGGDLGGLIDVNCQHYSWRTGQSFPSSAYEYRTLKEGPIVPRPDEASKLYEWDGHRPLVLGEVFYYAGNVSQMAWIGGPDVYRGKPWADAAAARYARIAIEGARWQEVTAICPWVRGLAGAQRSFEPRAVFVREYNGAFAPGTTMKRTIRVFNDTRQADPLTLRWKLVFGDVQAAGGEKTYNVPPGHFQEDVLTAAIPPVTQRKDGLLRLELCARDPSVAQDRLVFSDSRTISALPTTGGPPPGLAADSFFVFDPHGGVSAWLRQRGQPFGVLKSLDAIPPAAKVLLIGPHALSGPIKKAAVPALRALVVAGNTLIVLEQEVPLDGAELPLPGVAIAGPGPQRQVTAEEFRQAGGRCGRICFPVAPAHPVLRDLKAEDFFTWAGDEVNFRLSYATPSSGAISILQAGDELGLTPLMELPVGRGSYLLSQMAIGEKLGLEPVADRLLANMLTWAAARGAAKPGRTKIFAGNGYRMVEFASRTGLVFELAQSPEDALTGDVAVVRAGSDTLAWLAKHKPAVDRFCARGGWMMIVGLDPDGLKSFNSLVGFEHRIRPYRREASTLDHRDDPLLLGLSDRDIRMKSDEVLAAWANLFWVSDRVFSYVVDGEEIAAFGGNSEAIAKLTNGFTNEDFWRYAHYFDSSAARVSFDFGRPETITAIRIKPTAAPYYFAKDVEFVFDDDAAHPLKFTCQQVEGPQPVPVQPRAAAKIVLTIKSHYPGDSAKDLVGLDLLEIYRQMPRDSQAKVVMLSQPGGLVKYPIGRGGIVLNQIDYLKLDTKENVQKKVSIYANLLRNMGAAFRVATK